MRKKTNNTKKFRPIVWAVLIALIIPFSSILAESQTRLLDLEAKNVLLVRLTEGLSNALYQRLHCDIVMA